MIEPIKRERNTDGSVTISCGGHLESRLDEMTASPSLADKIAKILHAAYREHKERFEAEAASRNITVEQLVSDVIAGYVKGSGA